MRSNIVYLAGPITGLTYEGATDWRKSFVDVVTSHNPAINCMSPMRAKHHLEAIGEIPATGNGAYGAMSGGPAIVARDYADTVSSDIIVVNLLGAKRVSIGTMFEIAWAYSQHIPVVLVIEDGLVNLHSHSMLFNMVGYRVNNLNDAIKIVTAFFAANVH